MKNIKEYAKKKAIEEMDSMANNYSSLDDLVDLLLKFYKLGIKSHKKAINK